MTIRNAYEYALIESNKLKAPALLLEDYIYLFNKAIQQKINEIYNRYDINQQSSDDLRVLQTTVRITSENIHKKSDDFGFTIWEVDLPSDYLHLLNCLAQFTGSSINSINCDNTQVQKITSNCQRLTADLQGGIMNNYYMQPSHKKPYYYIINNNLNSNNSPLEGTTVIPTNLNMDQTIINQDKVKDQYDRKSNQSIVKLEIHTGKSN